LSDPRPLRIRITDEASLSSAVLQSSRTARTHGFDTYRASTIATVTSELGRNILKYAGEGEILIQTRERPKKIGIEVTAQDRGPGIDDVEQALADHFSTSGTLGLGLPGVQRLVDEFEVRSRPAEGVTVRIVKWLALEETTWVPASQTESQERSAPATPHGVTKASGEVGGRVSWASYSRPMFGQQVCGDAALVKRTNNHLLIVILDGLGHGAPAFEAAGTAVALLERVQPKGPGELLTDLHERMKGTVGAACGIALLDIETLGLRYAGVGNTSGRIFRAANGGEQSLLGANGTLGQGMRSPVEASETMHPGDLFILHTDGIQSRFGVEHYPQLRVEDPTVVAKALVTRFGREYDDATTVVVKTGGRGRDRTDG